jgi:hypothetical protein
MAVFAADLAVWAEGAAYCRWIEVEDSRVRTRRDLMRDAAESFRKLLLLPYNIFFAQLRMSKQTLRRLALAVRPLFVRSPSMRGRKPEPFIFALTYTIRCLAQGVSSWSALSVDWNVGESTLRGWIPQTCRAISEALPIPQQPAPSDSYAWQARFHGFFVLKQARISKNQASRPGWRQSLPAHPDFLGNIAFVLDGMVTPLAEAPRVMQRGGGSVSGRAREEFFCARYSTYAINNMIAVDARE